uniref:Ig-like domain-containing protein n=1 Tax=Strigamia maritima TaxID=126957 RepID=T1J6G7_STRMM
MVKLDLVILFIPVLLSKAAIEFVQPLPAKVEGILNKNFTLSCRAVGEYPLNTFWIKNGEPVYDKKTWTLVRKAELKFSPVHREDAGKYACIVQTRNERQSLSTQLIVASPPNKLVNVSVHATTILATVSWHVVDDDGYAITSINIGYRQVHSEPKTKWHRPVPEHISPVTHQFDIFKLKPNTTYELKIWACNKWGSGDEVYVKFVTAKETDPIELARNILAEGDENAVKAWILAVLMVLGTIIVLCIASSILLYQEWKLAKPADERFYEDDLDVLDEKLKLINNFSDNLKMHQYWVNYDGHQQFSY